MSLTKAMEVSGKLREYRDSLVSLQGEVGFVATVKKWESVFIEVMDYNSCGILEATTELLARARDHSGELMLLVAAVGCELAEPKYTISSVQAARDTE
ncbi:hypothetical protein [Teredinibacter purpureus]|uniref:hypothetical protein n=1 Tax=Teredinibacter purpureus TaxID=2731756 RepID=UPI0005F7737B|nr:hypothetical protein [Teredinibacter purpureus]